MTDLRGQEVAGLRALADLIESDLTVPVPQGTRAQFSGTPADVETFAAAHGIPVRVAEYDNYTAYSAKLIVGTVGHSDVHYVAYASVPIETVML